MRPTPQETIMTGHCVTYNDCNPHGGHYVVRRFITKEERKERLQAYAEALDKELTGVKERIAELDSA